MHKKVAHLSCGKTPGGLSRTLTSLLFCETGYLEDVPNLDEQALMISVMDNHVSNTG